MPLMQARLSGLLDDDRSNVVPSLLVVLGVGPVTVRELLGLPAPAQHSFLTDILTIDQIKSSKMCKILTRTSKWPSLKNFNQYCIICRLYCMLIIFICNNLFVLTLSKCLDEIFMITSMSMVSTTLGQSIWIHELTLAGAWPAQTKTFYPFV